MDNVKCETNASEGDDADTKLISSRLQQQPLQEIQQCGIPLQTNKNSLAETLMTQSTDNHKEVWQKEQDHMTLENKNNCKNLTNQQDHQNLTNQHDDKTLDNQHDPKALAHQQAHKSLPNQQDHISIQNQKIDFTPEHRKQRKIFVEPVMLQQCGSYPTLHQVAGHDSVLSHSVPEQDDLSQDKSIEEINMDQILPHHSSITPELPHDIQAPFQSTLNYVCIICDNYFQSRSDYENHYSGHKTPDGYKCYECPHVATKMQNLQMHYKVHKDYTLRLTEDLKPVSYTCDYCYNVYTSLNDVINHSTKHKVDDGYRCLQCPEMFVTKGHLINHSRSHLRDINQEICIGNQERH